MTGLEPIAIDLHKKSRLLEIQFSNNFSFNYPCEYLRVFAESNCNEIVSGKAGVNISEIHRQGDEAIRLVFDDGYDQGTYSWEYLQQLGLDYEKKWAVYLEKLEHNGLSRGDGLAKTQIKTIKIYYFIELAKISKQDTETVELPAKVIDVQSLLGWLRERGEKWHTWFNDDRVQATVNKHFSEPDTPLEDGDEIAIVPLAMN